MRSVGRSRLDQGIWRCKPTDHLARELLFLAQGGRWTIGAVTSAYDPAAIAGAPSMNVTVSPSGARPVRVQFVPVDARAPHAQDRSSDRTGVWFSVERAKTGRSALATSLAAHNGC